MGSVIRKKKKKMGSKCGKAAPDGKDNDSLEYSEEEYQNPTELGVLYGALRRADELRNDGYADKAVVVLRNAFDKAIDKLAEVPEDQYKDTMLLMQTIKDCSNQWKNKNLAYNPNYRRLKHLKLDLDEDMEEEANESPAPFHYEPQATFSEIDPPAYQDLEAESIKIPQKEDYDMLDEKDLKMMPLKPLPVGEAPALFSQSSFSTDPTSIDTLYLALREGNKHRQAEDLDEALFSVKNAFDNCLHNMDQIKDRNRLAEVSLIMSVLRDCQNEWGADNKDYAPNFLIFNHLDLPDFDDQQIQI